jgi:hypothetical protein
MELKPRPYRTEPGHSTSTVLYIELLASNPNAKESLVQKSKVVAPSHYSEVGVIYLPQSLSQ